jgi:hypothetical protein
MIAEEEVQGIRVLALPGCAPLISTQTALSVIMNLRSPGSGIVTDGGGGGGVVNYKQVERYSVTKLRLLLLTAVSIVQKALIWCSATARKKTLNRTHILHNNTHKAHTNTNTHTHTHTKS